MSSLENVMDAEETMSWVEQQSASTAEWGARRRGRKERWEIDKAREASELEPSTLDPTSEAIEPRGDLEWEPLTHNSEDKGDYFLENNSSP